MPCGDGGPEPRGYLDIDRSESAARATRAACDMRTVIRSLGAEHMLCSETLEWISDHDREDAARIALAQEQVLRERAKASGLRKLSLEERRALGL